MIKIYGRSDDLVVIEGDVYDETSSSKSILIGTEQSGCVIKMKYGSKKAGLPVWTASIRQIDEGVLIPWLVRIENAPPAGMPNPQSYSVMVIIDCPPGTPIKVGKKLLK